MPELEIIHTTDKDGRPVVLVPLHNSDKPAVVDEMAFSRLMAMGIPVPWRLYRGRVQVWNDDRMLSIARLIADAQPEEKIIYRNRNRIDLTMPNLIIDTVRSSAKDNVWATNIARRRKHTKLAHKVIPSKITLKTFGLE